MKRATARLFCLLAALCFCFIQRSVAQGCRLDYTPNYALYASATLDDTYVYTTVLTDGSTSGSGSAGCNYPNARHTAQSYNKLGTAGGTVYGTPGYMTSYLSVQNNQQIVGVPGTITFDAGGEVICSVFGTFFSTGGHLPLTLSYTYGHTTSSQVVQNTRFCNTVTQCTSGVPTCPPPPATTYTYQVPASDACFTDVYSKFLSG